MGRISNFDVSSSPRDHLCAIRQNPGNNVNFVGNGQEEPGNGGASQSDCLLFDYTMPVLDRLYTLEALPTQSDNLSIIMLTTDVPRWKKSGYFKLGITNFLTKPITQTQLQEASQQIIQTHPSMEVPCT